MDEQHFAKKNNNREDGEAKRKLREKLRVHTCECVRCVGIIQHGVELGEDLKCDF